jgi:hypothetical protein
MRLSQNKHFQEKHALADRSGRRPAYVASGFTPTSTNKHTIITCTPPAAAATSSGPGSLARLKAFPSF